MTDSLPPLKSLEVFVRAAQMLSFGEAAAELGLSPSAVSRRIRALETELDTLLFVRRSKSVELTPAGSEYLAALAPAFSAIRLATSELRKRAERLVITAPQSFAVSWLTPRLPDFRERFPEIDLDIEVSADITGRSADGFDIGIFLSTGSWPGRHADLLSTIATFPVCHPALAEGLATPADLAELPLLHVRQLPNAWDEWLDAAGAAAVLSSKHRRKDMHFNDVQLAYEAARRGLGVAVGADLVVGDYLRDGRLVAPFAERVESGFSYHFVASKSRLRDPPVRKLRQWLIAQAKRTDLR